MIRIVEKRLIEISVIFSVPASICTRHYRSDYSSRSVVGALGTNASQIAAFVSALVSSWLLSGINH